MPLEDSLNEEFAPAWRPEAGETLIGTVTEISTREGGYGPYRVLTLRRDDGARLAVHAFHHVLVEELKKIRPQIGHRIGIRYLGRPEGKNYDLYKVATENPPTVDWGAPEVVDDVPPPPPPSNGFVPQAAPVPTGVKADDGDDVPF